MPIINKVYQLFTRLQEGVRPLLPVLVLIIYNLAGAQIFLWCEHHHEEEQLKLQYQNRLDLVEGYAYELHKLDGMPARQKHDQTVLVLKNFTEVLGINVNDVPQKQWTFINSAFYALTVYTTIGYGNIYPSTSAGQVITIIYAFFGIPLALITLIVVGSLFARICKLLWKIVIHSVAKSTSIVSKDIEKQVKRLDVQKEGRKSAEDNEDLLSFPVSFLIGITIVWVFICAALFTRIENDWNYGTSLYFTLISFTTIGFGDVLPSETDYMIIVGLCVLIGLSLVSTVLNIIQQQIEALGTKMETDIDKDYKEALTEAYDEDTLIEEGKIIPARKRSRLPGVTALKEKLKVESVVAKMSFKDRMLYNAMSSVSKEKIKSKAEKKMNTRVIGIQTDVEVTQNETQTVNLVSQDETQTDCYVAQGETQTDGFETPTPSMTTQNDNEETFFESLALTAGRRESY